MKEATLGKLIIRITDPAAKFMEERGIYDVTFELIQLSLAKEIVPRYQAPEEIREYRHFKSHDRHIYIFRKIRIIAPLVLTTEWGMGEEAFSVRGLRALIGNLSRLSSTKRSGDFFALGRSMSA